ncbi:MAG: O-antigen ligase family protein [Salibacteraceae bacterium]
MKQFKKNWFRATVNILLPLVFLFPILPLKVASIILIVLLLVSLAGYFINRINTSLSPFPLPFYFTLSIPILYLVFFFFSEIPKEAWFHFEKKMALIAVPLTFYFLSNQNLHIKRCDIFNAFSFSAIVLSICSLLTFIYSLVFFTDINIEFSYLSRTMLENLTGVHPTYFALFTLTAALINIYQISENNQSHYKKYRYLTIIVLLIGTILSGSRGPIFGFVIALLYLAYNQFGLSKKAKIVATLGLLALVLALSQAPIIGVRIMGVVNLLKLNFGDLQATETSLRVFVWGCDYVLIKEHWLRGVGTGEIQVYLDLCYNFFDQTTEQILGLNTHNEFANIWLGTGLIGLLFFIGYFISHWRYFEYNWLGKATLILFGIVCMTENLLERQHGVFYAAFVLGVLVITSKSIASKEV